MKTLPLLVAAALIALAAPATAQMDFDEAHQVRIAYGDIPSTPLAEGSGTWNFQETVHVQQGSSITWTLPAGHLFDNSGCDGCTATDDDSQAPTHTLTCDSADNGTCAITIAHHAGAGKAFGTTLALRDDAAVNLYLPNGAGLVASQEEDLSLACTEGQPCTIHRYTTASATDFWFSVTPTPIEPEVITVEPTGGSFNLDFVTLLLGLIAGAGLWAFMVQRGVVQKRSRKQVAATAAHKEVASRESKPVLEARKKLLMAGLKELELAKQAQSVDTATYDALKAEWKKQTVTVMRALEEASE